MFTIFFTNFWYGPDKSWSTFEEALCAAKGYGFDCIIRRNGDGVGYWSIIRGYCKF